MNRSIVCGVDGTQSSRWAARVAGEIARELDQTLVLVHVAEDAPTFPYRDSRQRELQRRESIETATPMLERTAAAVPDVTVQSRVLFGDPVDELIAVGLEAEAELIVVGSRGRGPVASVLLGSVSARLAASAPCPVIVVPSPDAADRWLARPRHSRVVCGVDDSDGSIRALPRAADLADRLALELSLVHVDADESREDAPVGPLRGGLASLTVVKGAPAEVLREHAMDPDTSLLVVGSRGRTSWRAALGSVSRALAAAAPVPVMVVPPTAVTRPATEVVDAAATGVLRRAQHWMVTAPELVTRPDSTARVLAKDVTKGRFSTGIEQLPNTPANRREGRFSDRAERDPARDVRRVGSFADSRNGASS